MDISEGGALTIILADTLDGLFTFWHVHRIQIILAVVGCLVSVVVLRRRHQSRPPTSSLSPASEEKSAWLGGTGGQSAIRSSTSQVESVDRHASNPTQPEAKKPRPSAARVVAGKKPMKQKRSNDINVFEDVTTQPLIFFASLTGTTSRLSQTVSDTLTALCSTNPSILTPQTHDLSYVDLDDYFISGPKASPTPNTRHFYILLVPSYDID